MANITLEHVDKRYPNGYVAARDLSLSVADGEFLVLVGPSGSGKSTILRLIAGLEKPTGGRILIGGDDVTAKPPQERDIAMVFQGYALYPHMTVRENLGFGLSIRKQPPATVAARVRTVAESLGLTPMLDRKPAQLSGGQRQRVALGRAIVREPRAFLFDEPLSNLDAQLRIETRAELGRLHRRLGSTMVYVTHDQVEAMTLGTRVAVLKDGVLQQVAPPMDLYRRPANQFVAGFIGSPRMNLLAARVVENGAGARVEALGIEIPVEVPAGDVIVGVRPHDVIVGRNGAGSVRATVALIEPLGSEQVVHLMLPSNQLVTAVVSPDATLSVAEITSIGIAADAVHLFDAATGTRLASPRAVTAGR
jgi:multiple sugar transport system ATP-binding protein